MSLKHILHSLQNYTWKVRAFIVITCKFYFLRLKFCEINILLSLWSNANFRKYLLNFINATSAFKINFSIYKTVLLPHKLKAISITKITNLCFGTRNIVVYLWMNLCSLRFFYFKAKKLIPNNDKFFDIM